MVSTLVKTKIMIEQIKIFEGNTIAIEAIESFTETDAQLMHKFFEQKLNKGFKQVNVLVKLDEIKINQINTKAFFEHMVWVIRNLENVGNLAIVAHSNILKAMIPLDNVFFERLKKGFEERYFDVSQLEQALHFIESTTSN
jgi:hypothetical protein